MIEWLRAKTNPVPLHYECLLLLDDGAIFIGIPSPRHRVVGWSVLNRPDWLFGHGGGRQRGEDHPKATLSDADCDLIRELCDLDSDRRLTYREAAEKFDCSKSTVRDIVKCRTRAVRMIE